MNKKTENHIRNFGMSGYLITDDLNRVEKQFSVKLGHVSEDNTTYYPQFEQSVRNEASEMSQYYELFYCLEKSIRKLIYETLVESEGSNWWKSERIPQPIKSEVGKREQIEKDNGITQRSELPIDYTTFGELSVIIISSWDIFGTIFNSKRAVEKVMSNLNMLRGPIAHCCPMTEDEIDRLLLTVKDWFRIMS